MVIEPLPADTAAHYRATLLASDEEFRADWLAVDDKVVVPLEELGAFAGEPVGEHIVAAYQAEGDEWVLGLTTSDLGSSEPDQAARIRLDVAALDDWWSQVKPFSVVIASLDLRRATLVSVDEFALVAGSSAFVERAVGKPLPEARASFAAYAEDMKRASRHLPGVAAKYGC